MSGIKDLYVYKGGNVRLGSEARLGAVSQVREVALQSLHVQDGGTFEVDSGHHTNDVTVIADTIKVMISVRYTIKVMISVRYTIKVMSSVRYTIKVMISVRYTIKVMISVRYQLLNIRTLPKQIVI